MLPLPGHSKAPFLTPADLMENCLYLLPVQSLPMDCNNIQRSSSDGVLPPRFTPQSKSRTKKKSSTSPAQYAAQGKKTARFNTSGKLLPKDRLPSHFIIAFTWCPTLPWRWEVAYPESDHSCIRFERHLPKKDVQTRDLHHPAWCLLKGYFMLWNLCCSLSKFSI